MRAGDLTSEHILIAEDGKDIHIRSIKRGRGFRMTLNDQDERFAIEIDSSAGLIVLHPNEDVEVR